MFDPSSYDNPTPLALADSSRDVLPRGEGAGCRLLFLEFTRQIKTQLCAQAPSPLAQHLDASCIESNSIACSAEKILYREKANILEMMVPFLWFLLNGLGVCAESSVIPKTSLADDSLGYKWWIPIEAYKTGEMQKRSKRLILSRQEDVLPTSSMIKTLEPTLQTPLLTKKKSNRNAKKKTTLNGKDESNKGPFNIADAALCSELRLDDKGWYYSWYPKSNTSLIGITRDGYPNYQSQVR
ncbi:uncharacterized protein TNCV_662011 [Trichonephila clavipes]|nr:uncharacterized protein TNCV_662011 [Trichonephila clavipes]